MNGPDTGDNGVRLCSLHHKLFDMGVLGVTEDFKHPARKSVPVG